MMIEKNLQVMDETFIKNYVFQLSDGIKTIYQNNLFQ